MNDESIMIAYVRGFYHEGRPESERGEPLEYSIPLLQIAYNKGRNDYVVKGGVPSLDLKSREQIIAEIKKNKL